MAQNIKLHVAKGKTVQLDAKRTLEGNILVFDHPRLIIVISPEKKKIVAFPKEDAEEDTYDAQMRLFTFLEKKGVVVLGSVQGGSIYSSIQATIPGSDEVKPIETLLFVLSKYLSDEKEIYTKIDKYEDDVDKMYLEPDEEESTELGEVPHKRKKGTIPERPSMRFGGYYGYFY